MYGDVGQRLMMDVYRCTTSEVVRYRRCALVLHAFLLKAIVSDGSYCEGH